MSVVFCEGGQPGGLPGVIEGTDGGWQWDSDVVGEEGSKCHGLKGSVSERGVVVMEGALRRRPPSAPRRLAMRAARGESWMVVRVVYKEI
jgi:hypothetical protein